jgi:hypothetical protein
VRESLFASHMPGSSSRARSSTLSHHDPVSPLDPADVTVSMGVVSSGSSVPASFAAPPMAVHPTSRLQHGIRKTKHRLMGL